MSIMQELLKFQKKQSGKRTKKRTVDEMITILFRFEIDFTKVSILTIINKLVEGIFSAILVKCDMIKSSKRRLFVAKHHAHTNHRFQVDGKRFFERYSS
jgi:hypothetical protein